MAIGASIACSGVCLTVVDRGVLRQAQDDRDTGWFTVDVSGETVSRTAPLWQEGARLNLEQALKLGDELGGHIVTGHVDGVGEVLGICPTGDSVRVGIAAPRELAPYLAAKGSITVDGVSLTVNEVTDQPNGACHFALNIIPHTGAVTTLGALNEGDGVNLEIDVLARYLKRMEALRAA
jgi:riboflavin synthase